jgi:hypothetical protein
MKGETTMRIDGHALRRRDVQRINALIDKHWSSLDTETVDREGFLQGSWGPDCIELLNGGEDWVVCDRVEPNAIFYHEGRTTWVACRELFMACARHAPEERITWHLAR